MPTRIVHLPVSYLFRRLPNRLWVITLSLALTVAMAAIAAVGVGPAAAATAPVGLGTAGSFAVLAGSTVTNTGPSVINGDLGVSPGTSITGFPPGLVNGTQHSADAVALQAQKDLTIAYNDAAGRAPTATVTADLGGQTLVAGVYTGTTLSLTGTLTLDAQGNPNAVFIFQSAKTLITASASRIVLINGADPCNVFFQVGSSATLGTNSVFVGTILALTSITANTGATVAGRLLARNGAVTLDSNTITRPNCSVASTTSTSTTSTSPTSTTSTSPTSTTSTSPTSTTSTSPTSTTSTSSTSTTSTSSSTTTSSSSTTSSSTAPTTTGLTPASGPTGGGTRVTVTGSRFVPGSTSVTIGAVVVPAAQVKVSSATSLSFVTPAHAAGAVNVKVTTLAGTSGPQTFRYQTQESATSTLAVPGSGAPHTGEPGSVNPLNALIALGVLAAGAGLALRFRGQPGKN